MGASRDIAGPAVLNGARDSQTMRCSMASKYYVNTKAQEDSGDNEVHKEGCTWMPAAENRTYLGEFDACKGAVDEAKKTYPDTANGCNTCSNDCHTS
jgi:hypothetical protein